MLKIVRICTDNSIAIYFVLEGKHLYISMAKSTGSTILIALIILFTFPIWIGLAGGLFGMMAGLFGAIFGIIGGLFGAIFGAIGAIFKGIFSILFGWSGSWNSNWHFFPHIHMNGFTIGAIVVVIFLILRAKKS